MNNRSGDDVSCKSDKPEHNSPDSLQKSLNFVSCVVGRNFINAVKLRLRHILNDLGLLLNLVCRKNEYKIQKCVFIPTLLQALKNKLHVCCLRDWTHSPALLSIGNLPACHRNLWDLLKP